MYPSAQKQEQERKQLRRLHGIAMCMAVSLALLVIMLCNTLPLPGWLACFLVDKQEATGEINIFAAQNAMWIAFFCGMSQLFIRWAILKNTQKELHMQLLPEEPNQLLTVNEMPGLHRRISKLNATGHLGSLIGLMASQVQLTRSVEMANDVLHDEVENRQTEIDLGYNMTRYVAWLLPTLGFIGTVWGILKALSVASDLDPTNKDLLPSVISSMSVAFWTTLLALIMSCILMWFMHLVQGKEESYLNRCAQYCTINFINRLYNKKEILPSHAIK